jgi:hypothetical protein
MAGLVSSFSPSPSILPPPGFDVNRRESIGLPFSERLALTSISILSLSLWVRGRQSPATLGPGSTTTIPNTPNRSGRFACSPTISPITGPEP